MHGHKYNYHTFRIQLQTSDFRCWLKANQQSSTFHDPGLSLRQAHQIYSQQSQPFNLFTIFPYQATNLEENQNTNEELPSQALPDAQVKDNSENAASETPITFPKMKEETPKLLTEPQIFTSTRGLLSEPCVDAETPGINCSIFN